ncbi:MAG: phosphoribosylglycinamide formyltransferase [Coriobacteriaceae bacterium]|nr:phosphoribosylglycinamide formyltransferase [Coriobacteriaceae bacterium]
MTRPINIAVLISGSGTNLQAIIDAIGRGDLDAVISLVVSSNQTAGGIKRAERADIPCLILEPADYDDPEAVDTRLVEAFRESGVDYVVMAGYMRKVTPVLLDAFPDRVINLHPALLPRHPGAHGIQDAYDAHDAETGITIHFANAEYDKGPIIYQQVVEIRPDETVDELEARIHEAEHAAYPKVLQMIAEGRVQVDKDAGCCLVDGKEVHSLVHN